MELFDVYDENRKALNYTKERGESLKENEYNIGIEAWIFSNNKLLLTKRSPLKSHPNMWEVPGGCSQTNETSTDTLFREMKEEINLSLNNIEYKLLDTVLYKHQFVDIYYINTKIDINNIKLQKEEVSDIKLVTKEEMEEMITNNIIVPSVVERYNKIKDRINKDF